MCFKCLCMGLVKPCPTLCCLIDCSPPGFSVHEISPGKISGVGCHYILHGIFPIQWLKPHLLCLLYWHADSLTLSYLGSPMGLKYIASTPEPSHLPKGSRHWYYVSWNWDKERSCDLDSKWLKEKNRDPNSGNLFSSCGYLTSSSLHDGLSCKLFMKDQIACKLKP